MTNSSILILNFQLARVSAVARHFAHFRVLLLTVIVLSSTIGRIITAIEQNDEVSVKDGDKWLIA